eukprot:12996395-Alexandrium_andersonii.AAC.1
MTHHSVVVARKPCAHVLNMCLLDNCDARRARVLVAVHVTHKECGRPKRSSNAFAVTSWTLCRLKHHSEILQSRVERDHGRPGARSANQP